jgi:transcriptional regulator with XRE-family HTH domain
VTDGQDDRPAWARRLRAARRAKGLSQERLAARLTERLGVNVPRRYISRWETGEAAPSESYAQGLAAELAVLALEITPAAPDEEAFVSLGHRLSELEKMVRGQQRSLMRALRRLTAVEDRLSGQGSERDGPGSG